MSALWDVFGRFGDLIEVYILNGKNCGYVSYGRKESADKAIEVICSYFPNLFLWYVNHPHYIYFFKQFPIDL